MSVLFQIFVEYNEEGKHKMDIYLKADAKSILSDHCQCITSPLTDGSRAYMYHDFRLKKTTKTYIGCLWIQDSYCGIQMPWRNWLLYAYQFVNSTRITQSYLKIYLLSTFWCGDERVCCCQVSSIVIMRCLWAFDLIIPKNDGVIISSDWQHMLGLITMLEYQSVI